MSLFRSMVKLRIPILAALGVCALQACPSTQAARATTAAATCSFRFHPVTHGMRSEGQALVDGRRVVGSSALCVATYAAAAKLATDLAGVQSSARSAAHDTEGLVIDLETEQEDVETTHRDSLLATFETAAHGACRGLRTTLDDADTVKADRAAFEDDLATFSADSRGVTSGIRALGVDAATLRRDLTSSRYTPPSATSDLAAIPSTIDSARSSLGLARSFVAQTVQTVTTLSTRANGYATAAKSVCS